MKGPPIELAALLTFLQICEVTIIRMLPVSRYCAAGVRKRGHTSWLIFFDIPLTYIEDAAEKALEGITTFEEVDALYQDVL